MPVLRQPVPRVCDMFLNFPSIYLGGMKYNVYTAAMQVRASQSRVRQLRDAIGSFSTFYHVPTCIHTRVTCLTIESVLIRQGKDNCVSTVLFIFCSRRIFYADTPIRLKFIAGSSTHIAERPQPWNGDP